MSRRPRKARFEGETTIVIQGRRAEDGVQLVLGLVILALMLWISSEAILRGARDDNGLGLMAILTAPFVIWSMAGPFSRLRDRRPFFVADPEGLRLHPGFWPRDLPWSQIRSLSIQSDPFGGGRGGQSRQIRILLCEAARSSAYPFGTREIHLHLRRLGLSDRAAADLLRQLRRVRADGETIRSRDPDAGG